MNPSRVSRTRRVSRIRLVAAIVRKDLIEFSRDRLWMLLTPLALVMFAVVFWLLPATVEETIAVGVSPPALALVLDTLGALGAGEAEGLVVVPFASEGELSAAVSERARARGDGPPIAIGLAFGDSFVLRTLTGRETSVRVYLDAAVPPEVRAAMTSAVREAAYAVAGASLPVTLPAQEEIVLGVDRAGAQVPLRERMRPMLAFFVLVTESLALASLVSSEVASRTVTALLVTPARVVDVVAAKGLTGTALAFGQAVILLAVTASLGANAPVLLTVVLLGSVLMAGVSLLTGAAGRDFMGTLFLGMAFLIPLMVPAFGLLFPGSASAWVQVLPSYGVMQGLVGAASYGQGFTELAPHLLSAAAWAAAIFALGWWALSRKVARP
jgi:ABC-2 type transport system permease protein